MDDSTQRSVLFCCVARVTIAWRWRWRWEQLLPRAGNTREQRLYLGTLRCREEYENSR